MTSITDEELPIDIHYNKLLDWLVSRRHCLQQWQNAALVIREKINNAIQDMPAVDEITQLLQGTYINYFHCRRIVELLKQTEESSKNIFGRYSSQRMKDWTEIIKLYEKDDVYLAEAAQMVARNVNYEIPALKRHIAKLQQTQQDYTRKETEYLKNSSELCDKFVSSCNQMGIEGKKLRRELLELVKNMPSTYDDVARQTRTLNTTVQFYMDFIAFVLNSAHDCVPLVRHVIDKGNTTVYEWRTGHPPLQIQETTLNLMFNDDDEKNDQVNEIDWGDLVTASGDNIVNDNIVAMEAMVVDTEIDWNIVDVASNIDIQVVDDSTPPDSDTVDVACGDDALTVLDCPTTRGQFIDELLEVESFLSQRVVEMSCDGSDVLSNAMFQMAPLSLHVDKPKLTSMFTMVQSLTSRLTAQKMEDLFLIRNSPRYVDRLVDGIQKIVSDSEKMMSLSCLMVTRRQESAAEQREIEPKLDLIRQRTKQLQKQIEGEISCKYKNRRVNIMGEINTI